MKRGKKKEKIEAAIRKAGTKGATSKQIAKRARCNRQYVLKVIRESSLPIRSEGVPSPQSAPKYFL